MYTFDEILDIVNSNINTIKYKNAPQSLFEPITYILSLGGKRVRPALALMSYNLYKDDIEKVIPIALAVEVFHNFTLLHDDLMDRADMRRGKPTVHIKWNDNTAVLSGDAMLIEAYKEIAKIESAYLPEVLDLFSVTATEICCGQQYDMEFEQRIDVSIPEYLEMIRLKTAVLLACALKEGAIVAGASKADAENLYNFGINVGLGFQLKDDLLDVYGESSSFGKKIGGDILCNKKTFLLINALSDESAREELMNWINKVDFEETEKIKAVTDIYNKLGLKQKSEDLINDYYKEALICLDKVSVDKAKKAELYELAESLMTRIS
ncbi:polyprenyl synthetase family protein [Dysgonomonas sp. Marseille-P4677]|uniref:polyprenyl synthetase family protein n=1 Tax=Dysgonomonas sp. Marseille-P4677 TaxID=2364790 RepID=UPI001912819D|nr:polyprenyl synthetase family protein [Dysgonomonas sp. Marseille-P4677]MBK5720265.1 polyprenyl synthetase family protein [Dysgonomonas sp. Marseille-P4677]